MRAGAKPKTPSAFLVGALIDAAAPLATYGVMHALGVPAIDAMIAGSLVAVITMVANTVRQRRLDGVGLLVIAEIAASILLQFLLHDPRLLMIKPSFYSLIGGIYLLSTAFGDRPLTYEGSRPMATRGDPRREIAYARTWERLPAFRAVHRTATIGWGAAFLADAALRVVVVYAFPLDRAVWLAQVPHLAAMVLLVGFSALVGKASKPLVEEQVRVLEAEAAAADRQGEP